MRIIAGDWRGRKLTAPAGDTTRPTADRTRETLFSMLVSRLGSFEGLSVADLFAGSGALGLEALSRGAARCTFVEQDAAALKALKAKAAVPRWRPMVGNVIDFSGSVIYREKIVSWMLAPAKAQTWARTHCR